MVGLIIAVALIVLAGAMAVSTAVPSSPSMARAPRRVKPGRIPSPAHGDRALPAGDDTAALPESSSPVATAVLDDPDALDIGELGGSEPASADHRVFSAVRLVLTIAFLGAAAGATTFLIGRSLVLLIRLIAGVDDAALG